MQDALPLGWDVSEILRPGYVRFKSFRAERDSGGVVLEVACSIGLARTVEANAALRAL